MNHIHSFDQYSILEKEGLIQKGIHKAKELLGLKSTFRVRYTVTLYSKDEAHDEKEEEKTKKRHGMNTELQPVGDYTMNVNIRAVNEDDAEERFMEKFDKLADKMDPRPTVHINQIRRTGRPGKRDVEIPQIKKEIK